MEREIAELTGRNQHEIITYKHEIDEQKRDIYAIRDELRKKHQELERVTEDFEAMKAVLKKHQTNLADMEIVHQKYVQEAHREVVNLKLKVETATSELQAKVSQVKQYTKENDTLKQEIQKLKQQVTGQCVLLCVF